MTRPKHRSETRQERYAKKREAAQSFNVIPVCINFMFDENVAFVLRSAACFGAKEIAVVGQLPSEPILRTRSGGLLPHINIKTFQNPHELISHIYNRDGHIVASELCDGAINIESYSFPTDKEIWLILGHEETGVPEELLLAAHDLVYIPMRGIGYSLNVSQTANIMLYEYIKQLNNK